MEIAIISGKGGTGKSSISAAFASMGERVVLADCDVDAANLHILFNPAHEDEEIYISGYKTILDNQLCTRCGLCSNICRFDAINFLNGIGLIDDIACDGCKLCSRVCPENAIHMEINDKSRMFSGSFRYGKMVYGILAPGEENSGKLVNMVRAKALMISKNEHIDNIIIDGPPGIGCAVISSITGADSVVIITEPTISGLHDLKRTIEITSLYKLKTWVIINKFDLNHNISKTIENYCFENGIQIAGKLHFDPVVVEAMVNCKSIVEYDPCCIFSKKLTEIWDLIS